MVRARRKGAPTSWVGTKISGTIVEFGLPLIEQWPPDPSRRLCEQTFELVIMIWNAYVLARFWGEPQHLAALEDTIRNALAEGVLPIDALEAFEALSARRECSPFADDPRAVGHWELRETPAGKWNLHCDARIPPT